MTNRTEYFEILYGAWYAGAAVVPINAKLHVKVAAWIIENAGVEIAVISEDVGTVCPGCLREIIAADRAGFFALLQRHTSIGSGAAADRRTALALLYVRNDGQA